jgi:hypothetical protein
MRNDEDGMGQAIERCKRYLENNGLITYIPMKEQNSTSVFSFFGHESSSWLMRVSAL